MNRFATLILVVVFSLSAVSPAFAATATGATVLLAPPTSGTSVNVDVSIVSATPVVAYEFSIQNVCSLTGRSPGKPDSIQTDPIVNWQFSDATGTVPHAVMTIYLTTIPAGAVCKVSLLDNNQVVKGSTNTYTVQ